MAKDDAEISSGAGASRPHKCQVRQMKAACLSDAKWNVRLAMPTADPRQPVQLQDYRACDSHLQLLARRTDSRIASVTPYIRIEPEPLECGCLADQVGNVVKPCANHEFLSLFTS
jgi:hypothetical protein